MPKEFARSDAPSPTTLVAIFLTDLAFARPTPNGCPGIIAAYNAGPARYAAYLARRQRLPAETVAYVNAVT